MSESLPDVLPMFPLNTVVFPGVSIPLNVFEDRYTALVRHLMQEPDQARRLFGSVAIREGYEVGNHGIQSLYRVGCLLQLTEIETLTDGGFNIMAIGRGRFRLDRMVAGGEFPAGHVTELTDGDLGASAELQMRAKATFTAYRAAIAPYQGDPLQGALPQDPHYLAWTLSEMAPLPMAERQSLLEADDTASRLERIIHLLRDEVRAMNVIPSLPATEVARTRWSPN